VTQGLVGVSPSHNEGVPIVQTLSQMVVAAAQLGVDELQELHRQIAQLVRKACSLSLSVSGTTYRLVRLDDDEFRLLLRRSLAIEEDLGFQLNLHWNLARRGEDLNFAQLYLTLKEVCGESGQYIDDWKGVFSFPFAVDVCKHGQDYTYLLEVHTCRDSLYFPLRKVVPKDDPRLNNRYYYSPLAAEFSREDINTFLAYFYGYLLGRWEAIANRAHAPFLRVVPAAYILFGCWAGQPFEERYRDQESFERAQRLYLARIEAEKASRVLADPCVIRPVGGG
jgi:hypothetical protein